MGNVGEGIRIIDADTHVSEPEDLSTSRVGRHDVRQALHRFRPPK
jgi:hypothetical protein